MRKRILLFLLLFSFYVVTDAQIYIDEFDNGVEEHTFANTGLSSEEANGEWTITGDGTSGAFEIFGYSPFNEAGEKIVLDITENNKIYVRAKASNIGTQLRMDVVDAAGFATTQAGISKTLLNDYEVFEFDFTDAYIDGGFGGTACEAGPCPVDGSMMAQLSFYINPGQPGFAGTVVIDFISIGSAPSVGPMSDVYQDQFDGDSTINFLGSTSPGLVNIVEDSQWKIIGDGTNGMWDPVTYLIHNATTLEETDIDLSAGENKIYLRMRSTVPGTSFRLDIQDRNDFVTTAGSITKVLTGEWQTYEYNFAGSYQDLAFGGTGCEEGPCNVDPSTIYNLIMFVNPGVEGFAGEVHVDYISVGTPLENDGTNELVLAYGDHFSDDDAFISSGPFITTVDNSNLSITGDGTASPFAAVAYSLHDSETGQPVVLDATGNNKLFLSAKSSIANTLLRVDLIDTTGFVTSQPAFTRLLEVDEFGIIELDFNSSYIDGGFGGSPCESGPCEVDGTAIETVLFYPNPADGGFNGTIDIDFLSFGAPLGEDVQGYSDQFDDGDRSKFSDVGGFTVEENAEGELVIIGDGTAGPFAAFSYVPHDDMLVDQVLDITSNNKIYIRAKASSADVPLRIDVVDTGGFVTTNPSVMQNLGEEFTVIEYDFTGTFIDGAFGGTACETGPCSVDGSQVAAFLFYVDPVNGGSSETITIDWFSTLVPLEGGVEPPVDTTTAEVGINDYFDEFDNDDASFASPIEGLEVAEADGVMTITGDGTQGAFAPIVYRLHQDTMGIRVNAESNENKLFIRVKTEAGDIPFRVDLEDYLGFLTTANSAELTATPEWQVLEYDYVGRFSDGGFGGTACDVGPCPVDAQRIEQIQFYINAGVGGFNDVLTIDWISFGEPLVTNVINSELLNSAVLFPNPAQDLITMRLDIAYGANLDYHIYDLTGRLYNRGNAQLSTGSQQLALDISQLTSGTYMIATFIDGKPAFHSKFIKR